MPGGVKKHQSSLQLSVSFSCPTSNLRATRVGSALSHDESTSSDKEAALCNQIRLLRPPLCSAQT